MRLSCFGGVTKMVEHYTCYTRKKISKLLAKYTAEQQEDNSMDDIYLISRTFAELNNPLSPTLADKHALSKMNLTSMEVACFSLFLN